ncbi:hypothetical protein [Oceanispirochaeta sp.]|uniref:hypothetical protein n=1 Tax=Oceanispirochaeta sp. TaxID=2035350 RepID=UPI0026087930|nr:hypothetical protein [Oceanispirochaeta sp.]MDA3955358.1 hypothetical protein [Oceanispirochaeta sp.]
MSAAKAWFHTSRLCLGMSRICGSGPGLALGYDTIHSCRTGMISGNGRNRLKLCRE